MIDACDPAVRGDFGRRVADLAATYEGLSAVYQASKGSGAEIPLA